MGCFTPEAALPLDAFFPIENSHFWTPGALDMYLERVKMAASHALPCIGMWYCALDTFQVAKFTTYASSAIWWPNLKSMQVAPSGGN